MKKAYTLLALSATAVILIGIITPASAGNGLFIPIPDDAEVQDNNTIIDLIIWLLTPVPDPAPGPSGWGTITGLSGGNPVLIVTTSHDGVCDSEDQTLGTCEGLWHQHHVVLVDESLLDPTEVVCPDLPGTQFRVEHLSFESPGTTTIDGEHISFWNAQKNEEANDAINGDFPGVLTPFMFGPDAPAIMPTYPVATFNIYVNPDLGLDGLGVPVPNADGKREVCVYDVALIEVPHAAKVGGEFLGVNTTALLIAGLQSSALWLIPTFAGIVGVGIYLTKLRTNKN